MGHALEWKKKSPLFQASFIPTFIENSKRLFLLTEKEQNSIHEF